MQTLRLALPLIAALLTSLPAVESAGASAQPALTALVAPRAAELSAAGIQRIVARPGQRVFDVQVLTVYGPSYFAWPGAASPAPFELEVGPGATVTVSADRYAEEDRERYAAAFDAVLREAIRAAGESRDRALRPRP